MQMTAMHAKPFNKVKNTRDLFYQLYKRGLVEALDPGLVEPGSGRCLWTESGGWSQCEDDVLDGDELCHYHRHISDIGHRAKGVLWALKQHPLSQIQEIVMGSTPRECTDFLASCLFVDQCEEVTVLD